VREAADDTQSSAARASRDWWRTAVIYQVYLRSFADGDGDGVGDLPGLRARLPYLAGLGVDAVWITPWYPSPMADGGYDVSDFRGIDPLFGTLDDAQAVLDEAHRLGIRVMVDIVPNHTSAAHPWFREALSSPPGSAARARYLFRDGRGAVGDVPPTNWISAFGGPAWTRVQESDGRPGQWYLHLFASEQPDLDWSHADVREDFATTLRFWFDRGVDGFRIDVAMGLVKNPELPDLESPDPVLDSRWAWSHPYYDRDEVHDIWRSWRAIADAYDPPRVFVGEVALTRPDRLALYVRPDELHTVFNFDFLKSPWDVTRMRQAIDSTIGPLAAVGAPATWVLSNHDEPRHLTRFGLPDTGWRHPLLPDQGVPDLELGTRRARAAILLMLALPGGAYIYQGEELGLEQVLDLPEEVLRDPTWERSGRTIRGRDGCRVPIPWAGQRPPFGFGTSTRPWLPQPASWSSKTVEAESFTPGSMLSLYRRALEVRRAEPRLRGDQFGWVDLGSGALCFERGSGFACAVNFGPTPIDLPAGRTTLVRSDDGTGDRLAPDAAEWFTTSPP
jgi:alpha-glucosidase